MVLGLLPTLALGQSVRCGSELVAKGASQAKVAAYAASRHRSCDLQPLTAYCRVSPTWKRKFGSTISTLTS